MARRNMDQIIERTRVPEMYQFTASEWIRLADRPELDAIRDAFVYGFALGMRCQKTKGGKR